MIRRDKGKMMTVFVDPYNATLQAGWKGASETFGFESRKELARLLKEWKASVLSPGEKPERLRVSWPVGSEAIYDAGRIVRGFARKAGCPADWISPEAALGVTHRIEMEAEMAGDPEYAVELLESTGPTAVLWLDNFSVRIGFDDTPENSLDGFIYHQGSDDLARLFVRCLERRLPGTELSCEEALYFLGLGNGGPVSAPEGELDAWHTAANEALRRFARSLLSVAIGKPGLVQRFRNASEILLAGTFYPVFLGPPDEEAETWGEICMETDEEEWVEGECPFIRDFLFPLAGLSCGDGFDLPLIYMESRPGSGVTYGMREAPPEACRPLFALFD
jgi:hypothetical protein